MVNLGNINIKQKTWKHLVFSGFSVFALNIPLLMSGSYPDSMKYINAGLLFAGVLRAWSEEMKENDMIDIEKWQNDVENGKFNTFKDSLSYHKSMNHWNKSLNS